MTDAILAFTEHLMSSPWIYLALFAFAALDAFLPVVPNETLVIRRGCSPPAVSRTCSR